MHSFLSRVSGVGKEVETLTPHINELRTFQDKRVKDQRANEHHSGLGHTSGGQSYPNCPPELPVDQVQVMQAKI